MSETGKANAKSDEAVLAEIGYQQELKRDWNLLQNFGVSFSIISVVTGITTLFATGLNVGGPAVMTWGWIAVSLMTILVGLSMAEIVSAIPTSGGPYFCSDNRDQLRMCKPHLLHRYHRLSGSIHIHPRKNHRYPCGPPHLSWTHQHIRGSHVEVIQSLFCSLALVGRRFLGYRFTR